MIPVQVEADVSDGMPQFTMVGYVSAGKGRRRTACGQPLKTYVGISLPPGTNYD